jgi:hypothetical protein
VAVEAEERGGRFGRGDGRQRERQSHPESGDAPTGS